MGHSPYPCDGLIKKPYGVFSCQAFAKWRLGEDGLRVCPMHLNQALDIIAIKEYTLVRLDHG